MAIALLYSKRSVCKYFKVGVAFARDKYILSAGYNGPPVSEPHCIEVGCAKENKKSERLGAGSGLCRGAHAEMNAVANASRHGVNLVESTVYCTVSPCYDCAKVLTNLGIKEFVYLNEYTDEDPKAIELFKRQKIKVRKFKFEREVKI